MCITIQVKLKTAIIGVILFGLFLGTYFGDKKYKQIDTEQNSIIATECVLMNTVQPDVGVWHNNWQYIYDNQTYVYTDETTTAPETHKCCITTNNLYDPSICTKNGKFLLSLYLGCAYVSAIIIFGCMWVCRDKDPNQQTTVIHLQRMKGIRALQDKVDGTV
jgi:hypothetical protein